MEILDNFGGLRLAHVRAPLSRVALLLNNRS